MAMTGRFASLMRAFGLLIALGLVVVAAVHWAVSAPGTIGQSIAHSAPADQRALQAEAVVLNYVKKSRSQVILYLNPDDIGDNFYRLRYALYPIQFVPYWSWTNPNQGGKVWTIPVFTTVAGLRSTMLNYHVDYVLAVSGPKLLDYLHLPHAENYLLRVNQHLLKAGKALNQSLVEVTRWP